MSKNRRYYRIAILLFYVLMFVPYIYSIFYSMPATDDYAWAIEWFSKNRLVETLNRVSWNYMNWFGQSGILAVVIQVLLNPLYWFKDVGHSFGICMVIVFAIIVIGLIIALRELGRNLLEIEDDFSLDMFPFLVVVLLFSTYYYSDVYNWWSGMPGYSFNMIIMLFSMSALAGYLKNGDAKSYKIMLITGIIACMGLMNCVTVGLYYIFMVFLVYGNRTAEIKKKILPLVLFVFSGLITVVAPGNYKRAEEEGVTDYVGGIYVSVVCIVKRCLDTVKQYPWVLALFIGIILLAMVSGSSKKIDIRKVLVAGLITLISAIGAVYPYIVGEKKAVNEELAPRAYFIADFILVIGFSLTLYCFGVWVSHVINKVINKKIAVAVGCATFIVAMGISKLSGSFMYFVPYDIYTHAEQIKTMYYTWEDIIKEIEESDEEDVVVEKGKVQWSRFIYPAGIDGVDCEKKRVGKDYYGNANQCSAIWYGKESIRVYIEY